MLAQPDRAARHKNSCHSRNRAESPARESAVSRRDLRGMGPWNPTLRQAQGRLSRKGREKWGTGRRSNRERDGVHDHHEPMQHRGRAALKRRVEPSRKEPGFSPASAMSRVLCETWDSTPPSIRGLGKRNDREWHDFSRAASPDAENCRVQRRGTAALKRRVRHPKRNRASARGCPIARPERSRRVSRLLQDVGFHRLPPMTWKAPRPGRPRLKSCCKPTATNPCSTVEERRLSARKALPKGTGLQPRECNVSRPLRDMGFHAPIYPRTWKAPRPGRPRLQPCQPDRHKPVQ